MKKIDSGETVSYSLDHLLKDEKLGADSFSLRNLIFQVEKKLRGDIQQRTGSCKLPFYLTFMLASVLRTHQTELFNIRETLRVERKNVSKISETAENVYRDTQQEIKQLRSEIGRQQQGFDIRFDKNCTQTLALVKELDQRVENAKRYGEKSIRDGYSLEITGL